jgi:hypothetical protein
VLTQQDRDRIAEMYATASGGGDLPLSYRDRVLAAMTAAGVVAETADGVIQPVYDLAKGRLSEKAFYDAVSAAGLTEMAHAEWPYEGDLEDVGEVLFREGSSGVYRLDDGSIVDGQLILWQGSPAPARRGRSARSRRSGALGRVPLHHRPRRVLRRRPVYMVDVLLADSYSVSTPSTATRRRGAGRGQVARPDPRGHRRAALGEREGEVRAGPLAAPERRRRDDRPGAPRPLPRHHERRTRRPPPGRPPPRPVREPDRVRPAHAPDGEASVAPRDALAVAVIPEVGEELAESFGRAFDLAAHLDPEVRRSFEDGFRRLTLRFLDAYQPTAALPAELQPRSEVPPRTDSPEPVPAAEAGGPLRRWQAVIAPEGRPTDDGRMFAPGSITWRDLPLTLMAMIETQPGHDGAQVSGRIDRIWREGSMLLAEGVFDEGEFGQEIARMVADGTLRGISVDLAIRQFEVGKITDYLDDDGNWISDGAAADSEPDLVDMLMGDEGDAVFVVTDAIIGAVTVCPFAAFADATISLTASGAVWTVVTQGRFEVTEEQREFAFGGLIASASRARLAPGEAIIPRPQAEALTAAAAGLAPVLPPAEWFRDPELSELTPLVVTAEGRVYGHAAAWDVCHIGIPGVCTTAPDSPSGYAYFHLKEVECDGGERVSCGTITLETGHADKRLGRAEAAAHYDDTGCAVADVIAGEDDFGIWVAGALRPSVEADKVRELRGAVLSGDWRNVNGELELVAILAVNVPGFPVPRPKVVVASGDDDLMHVMSLVAAGVHDGLHVASLLSQRDRERIAALAATAEGRFSDLAARAASA